MKRTPGLLQYEICITSEYNWLLLLQKGAEVNAKDKDGNTPLSLAVWQQHDR